MFPLGRLTGLRWSRALGIAILGWILLEFILAKLLANRFGWGPVVVVHSLKGGLGILLCGIVLTRGLAEVGRWLREPERGGEPQRLGFHLASAILVAVPGLVPLLLGIALFSPSLRLWVTRHLRPGSQRQDPRAVDLAPGEWRETRKPRRPRKAIARKPTLEDGPPSV